MPEGWEVGDDYECLSILGNGSYGEVCEAIQKSTGRHVAIKRMDKLTCNKNHSLRLLREIVVLRKLKHDFVIELVDIIEPKNP